MSRAELTPPMLGKRLRVSRQTVYKWLDGQLPSHRHGRAIEDLLGIPAWPVENVLQPRTRVGRMVPLVDGDIANAGEGGDGSIIINNKKHGGEMLSIDFDVSPETVALRIRGDSMEPEFHDGEIVIVDPGVHPRSGDCVVAEVDDKHGNHLWTFKQYRYRGNHEQSDIFDLVPLNPLYKTITIGPVLPGPARAPLPGRVVGTMVEHRRRRISPK